MAKENETNRQEAAAQQPQAPQPKPCPQDCRQCSVSQQIFCTTKMLFDLSRAMQDTSQRLSALELALDGIKDQLQPKTQDGELAMPYTE